MFGRSLGEGPTFQVDPILGLDSESVGDPVDVVEVRAHLGCIVDGPVVPTDCSEVVDVIGPHLCGAPRELL